MKAISAARARQAARKARDLTRRKGALGGGCRRSSPTARSSDPESDGALHRRGRLGRRLGEAGAATKSNQAILPLRGKIINSEKNRINKVLSNNEIQSLDARRSAPGIGEEFDIAKLRYHRSS